MTLVVQHQEGKGLLRLFKHENKQPCRLWPLLRGTAHGCISVAQCFLGRGSWTSGAPIQSLLGKEPFKETWGPLFLALWCLWEGGESNPLPVTLSASSLPCQSTPDQWTCQGLCPPTMEILINLRRGCMLVEGSCRSGPPGALWHRGRGDDVMGGEDKKGHIGHGEARVQAWGQLPISAHIPGLNGALGRERGK